MLLLQSNEIFDNIAEFEPHNGKINILSRKKNFPDHRVVTNGFFSEHQNGLLLLYRKNGELFFKSAAFHVSLNNNIHINIVGNNQTRRFEILDRGVKIFETTYIPVLNEFGEDDPTPFVEDEDFDFYLFVRNIANNQERRELIGR